VWVLGDQLTRSTGALAEATSGTADDHHMRQAYRNPDRLGDLAAIRVRAVEVLERLDRGDP
jgi:hypothetical protein